MKVAREGVIVVTERGVVSWVDYGVDDEGQPATQEQLNDFLEGHVARRLGEAQRNIMDARAKRLVGLDSEGAIGVKEGHAEDVARDDEGAAGHAPDVEDLGREG